MPEVILIHFHGLLVRKYVKQLFFRCDYQTYTNASLKKHLKNCEKAQELQVCGVVQCKKVFGTEISLFNHRQRDHVQVKLQCEACDYTTKVNAKCLNHNSPK